MLNTEQKGLTVSKENPKRLGPKCWLISRFYKASGSELNCVCLVKAKKC